MGGTHMDMGGKKSKSKSRKSPRAKKTPKRNSKGQFVKRSKSKSRRSRSRSRSRS